MLVSIKATGLFAVLMAALMTVIALASPASAGEVMPSAAAAVVTVTPANMTLAGNFKATPRTSRKQCNGQTTTDCCKGLKKCSCLYMPGSSSTNHPTACFSSVKTSGSSRS